MIPAVAQTLAEILAGGTSLLSTEQIDFNCPGVQQDRRPRLNLYCYNIQATEGQLPLDRQVEGWISDRQLNSATVNWVQWFDVSFLVSAWDWTVLGEQRLLSEALLLVLRHRWLSEELLSPTLRGYGNLAMTITALSSADRVSLWKALRVTLRPALYVTVTAPFKLQGYPPINWEINRQEGVVKELLPTVGDRPLGLSSQPSDPDRPDDTP